MVVGSFRTSAIRSAQLSIRLSYQSRMSSATEPSPASRDFRSDTITTPTRSMLDAMSRSTLGDDVYGEDDTTSRFENQIATALGHEAGLFVSSGTMGNQLAIRSHLHQPPHAILCDYRAHINTSEAGGAASLSQAMIQPIIPRNGVYLTLEDVKKGVILGEDLHDAPTRLIALENTLGGAIMPLAEVVRISTFARENGIKMHLDGARLWNAVAAGAGSLEEYGEHFDSVSVCFSKGIGAPIGSMLLGSQSFIKHARWMRKSIGGGMRQIGPIVNAAKVALEEVYPLRMIETHVKAKYVERRLEDFGLKTILPVDTSMLFIDLEDAGLQNSWLVEEGKKQGIKFGGGGRIVMHHQITDDAVKTLVAVIETVLKKKAEGILVYEDEAGSYGSLKRR